MKFSISFLLQETFSWALRHWWPGLKIAILYFVLFLLIGISLIGIAHITELPIEVFIKEILRGAVNKAMLFKFMPFIIVVMVIFTWQGTAFLISIKNITDNAAIMFKQSLITALKLFPTILLATLIIITSIGSLAIVLGYCCYAVYSMQLGFVTSFIAILSGLLSLIAMIFLGLRWALTPYILIIEQQAGLAAIRRSWQLSKSQWRPILTGLVLFNVLISSSVIAVVLSSVYMFYLCQQLTTLPEEELKVKIPHNLIT